MEYYVLVVIEQMHTCLCATSILEKLWILTTSTENPSSSSNSFKTRLSSIFSW